MISKLKLRCGAQYTSKMEGMLGDLAVAADHQRYTFCVAMCPLIMARHVVHHGRRDFEKFLTIKPPLPLEFTVQILTTGFWPSYKHIEVPLPPEMQSCASCCCSQAHLVKQVVVVRVCIYTGAKLCFVRTMTPRQATGS